MTWLLEDRQNKWTVSWKGQHLWPAQAAQTCCSSEQELEFDREGAKNRKSLYLTPEQQLFPSNAENLDHYNKRSPFLFLHVSQVFLRLFCSTASKVSFRHEEKRFSDFQNHSKFMHSWIPCAHNLHVFMIFIFTSVLVHFSVPTSRYLATITMQISPLSIY